MCFGNQQSSTVATNSNYTPASWLTNAAQNNVNFASNLQNTGFQPYTGQQVANFAPQQQASFGMGSGIAGAVTPNIQTAGTSLGTLLGATGSAPTVNASSIASGMSPYMNQYVQMALNPQIANANNQFALNQQLMQGQATSAGAFGDPRAQMLQQNAQLNNNLSMQGLVGNAYNAAFNTAIGASAQDQANKIQAQIASGQLQLGQEGQNLGAINTAFGQGVTATNLNNQLGGQQTAQQQAQLNAAYNQWLMAQQYPFQTGQLVNQSIGAATPASPSSSNSTQTTTQPNNSGYGILGALGGAALNAFLPGAGTALSGVLGAAGGGMFGGGQFAAPTTPFSGGGYSAPGTTFIGGNAYPEYAKGGRPKPGQPAIVGEKGPELFVPDKKKPLHRAMGGTMPVNTPTIVGENGPELVTPQQSGAVIPYDKLKSAIKKKKGVAMDGLSKQLGAAA